jgi:hypothetical protein
MNLVVPGRDAAPLRLYDLAALRGRLRLLSYDISSRNYSADYRLPGLLFVILSVAEGSIYIRYQKKKTPENIPPLIVSRAAAWFKKRFMDPYGRFAPSLQDGIRMTILKPQEFE